MRHTSVTLFVSDVVLSCDVSLYLIFVETTQTCFPARFRRLIVSSLCVVVCVFVDRVVSNTACVTCASLSSFLRFPGCVISLYKKRSGEHPKVCHSSVSSHARHSCVCCRVFLPSHMFPCRPHYGLFLSCGCTSLTTSARGRHLDVSRICSLS